MALHRHVPNSPLYDTRVLPLPQNNVIRNAGLGNHCGKADWNAGRSLVQLRGQKLNLIPGPVAQSQSAPWNRHFSKWFLDDPRDQSYLTPRKCLFVAQPVDHEIRLSGLADTPACRQDDLISLSLCPQPSSTHTHTHSNWAHEGQKFLSLTLCERLLFLLFHCLKPLNFL